MTTGSHSHTICAVCVLTDHEIKSTKLFHQKKNPSLKKWPLKKFGKAFMMHLFAGGAVGVQKNDST
jgi:hypothetical protein